MTEGLSLNGEYSTSVSSMEEPMLHLCEQLLPRFESGRYCLIIGDDTSGRLPALTIRGFSKYISKQVGGENMPLVFLQSSRKLESSVVEEQVDKRVMPYFTGDVTQRRVLIVTDFIQLGATLNRLGNILSSRGVSFDVAVMTYAKTTRAQELLSNLPQETEIFVGEEVGWSAPEIYNRPDMTGLKRPTAKDDQVRVIRSKDKLIQQPLLKVHLARKDINHLVSRIINRLETSEAAA